jgi:uncharacterized damage-inducible protein DinB
MDAAPLPMVTSLFNDKAWTNEELFALAQPLDEAKHKDERHRRIRLLNHIHVVDRIFAAHLTRTTHSYTATNTKETPTLDELTQSVTIRDRWYVDFVSSLDTKSLSEPIEFVFTDNTNAHLSREEMLMHVIAHGA